jgi:dTDP-4-dehydrorhamnose reductase
MKRILILGGGGMLGHKLVQTLGREFETWTTLRGRRRDYERFGLFDAERTIEGVDVTNRDDITAAIARVRPDAIINCVGIIKQLAAASDPIPSLTINSLLPHRLQKLAVAAGARLIHFSSDCVFDGAKGNYTEADPSDAKDLYGRTKFLGETSGPGALTIRTSIIGREIQSASGLVEWFLSNRGKRVKGFRRAIYTGFTTLAMARTVRDVLVHHPGLEGTMQVSSDRIDKYALLVLVRDAFGVDIEIEPDDTFVLDRGLDSSRFREQTGFAPPSWREMIEEMAGDPTPYDHWRTRQ